MRYEPVEMFTPEEKRKAIEIMNKIGEQIKNAWELHHSVPPEEVWVKVLIFCDEFSDFQKKAIYMILCRKYTSQGIYNRRFQVDFSTLKKIVNETPKRIKGKSVLYFRRAKTAWYTTHHKDGSDTTYYIWEIDFNGENIKVATESEAKIII